MHKRTGPNHGGAERRETEEAWAAQLLAEELKRRRWDAEELARRPKADAQKLKIARRLPQETTVTWAWIAPSAVGATSSEPQESRVIAYSINCWTSAEQIARH